MNFLTDYFDKTLIPEWRKAVAFLSVKADLIMGTLVGAWITVPDDQKAAFAGLLKIDPAWLVIVGIVIRLYYRLKKQPELHAEPAKQDPV